MTFDLPFELIMSGRKGAKQVEPIAESRQDEGQDALLKITDAESINKDTEKWTCLKTKLIKR